ncbi:LEPR-XLL domain-containing protein [Yoonia sp. GPGPB17]|uniref:beta strand repeat-containing protein n=1 Tax=Yoonia sp. GPGPB17 TaxID=3026147 RepID=UPI0030BDEE30
MSMPFDRQAAGVLPKIPLNRRNRARLRRNDRARFDKIKEAAWRLMLDPMEQRVLLSADPLNISAVSIANPSSSDALTVRFFEEETAPASGTYIQKVSVSWAGGPEDITEIGVDNRFVINTGGGDDDVTIIMDTRQDATNDDFEFVVNTEGGNDSITITSFAEGFVGDLNLSAEQITINSGVSLGATGAEVGNVTLAAADSASGTFLAPADDAVASVTIDGSIVSDGVVSVSADAVATASQTSYVASFSGFDLSATATVAVGDGVEITGDAVSLTADTQVDVDVSGDYVRLAVALTDVETTTTVSVGAGSTITAASGLVDGNAGDPSLRLSAETETNVDVELQSAANFFGGATNVDFTNGFDLLLSTLDVSRDTSVELNGTSGNLATLNAGGVAEVSAASGGDIKNIVKSDFVGVSTTDLSTDVTEILGTHLSSNTLGISMQASALTQTVTEGKVAVNESKNNTKTSVSLSNATVNAGASGIDIDATDTARFYAISTSATMDPGIFTTIDLDYAAALNLLDRDTTVVLSDATLDADGAVGVNATSAVWSIVLAEKMQALGTAQVPFDNSGTAQSFVFGGTMAVNEMNGEVSVTTTGGQLDGSAVTVGADNDAIFNAHAQAGQSLSGDSGGAVGISVAMNVLGFSVSNYLLLGVDALIGIDMGTTLTGYGAVVTMNGTAVNATGAAALTADNQLKANAFMSNAAESTADSAFRNNSGAAVAFALATNKIATRARVDISGATGDISASKLDVLATDKAEIFAETLIVSSSTTSSNFGVSLTDTLIANFANADYRTDGTTVYTDGIQGLTLVEQTGTVDLTFGDRVMALPDFTEDGDSKGAANTTYKFMGDSATGVDLAATDFTDKSLWQATPETDIAPTGLNFSKSDSMAFGGMLVRNEVTTEAAAVVADLTMDIGGDTTISATEATKVNATGDLGISSSGGSSIDGNGTSLAAGGALVINTVQGDATATVTNVDGTEIDGKLSVLATSTIELDATLNALVTSGNQAGLLLIAFNTLGYDPGNILEQSLDALIGLELGPKSIATTTAGIDSDDVTVGSVEVTATNASTLTSLRDSKADSAAAAATGAGGEVMSGTLVSNALAGGAEAYIRNAASGTPITTTTGGVTVTADDNATLSATSASVASQSTSNDLLSGTINDIAQKLLDAYTYTNQSGTRDMSFGDTVYVDGVVYKYMGEGPTSTDLATAPYTNVNLWKAMTATTIVPSSVAKIISKLAGLKGGDSKSSFAMITRNEVEGGAKAYIMNATVLAEGSIEVTATERSKLTALESSQVSAKEAKAGVLATNSVLSQAQAFVEDSDLTANGANSDINVKALNLIVADATVTMTTSAKGDALGLIFAFNTVGYDNHNVFFQAAEALLGADYLTPLVTESQTYGAEAYVNASNLLAGADINVTAESRDLQGATDSSVTAQMLDDLGNVAGDSTDAEQDASFAAALKAQLIAMGALEADSEAALTVETLAVGSQWYVIDDSGTIWQVLAELNEAGTDVVLNVYLVNLLNARVGNDQSVKAKNDLVLVDRFIAQDKLDADKAAAEKKGEEFKGKLKYGSSGAAAGGILASNKVLSETKAWIKGDIAKFKSSQTVSELLNGDIVRDGDRFFEYTGTDQVRVSDYDELSIATPVAFADQATIKLSADIRADGATFLDAPLFRAGDIVQYTGTAVSDAGGIDLEALIRNNAGSFAVINPAISIDLDAITFATDADWTEVLTTATFTATATDGTLNVYAADTANLRVDTSLSVLAEVKNNIDGFKKLAADLTKDDYSYTTSSGTQDLFKEDVVRIGDAGGPASEIGKYYKFIGNGIATIAGGNELADFTLSPEVSISVDLGALVADGTTVGAQNLLDTDYWQEISDNTDLSDVLFPDVGNLADSNSKALGGIIILNDVQGGVSATVDSMTVVAGTGVDVTADANASLLANLISSVESSGGSAWGTGDSIARQGVISTNVARNSAVAEIANSDITANGGDVDVKAMQQTVMDATLNATSNTGDEGVTVTLAFNSLGYNASNVLFNTIEAVTADPTFHRLVDPSNPTSAEARITASDVDATGDVVVDAQSAELLNATVSNTTNSAAGALTGAGGSAFGLIIASNKVLGEAHALIDNAQAGVADTIDAGGDISVTALDKQRHFSNVKLVADSATVNDGGAAVLQETLNDVTAVDWSMNSEPEQKTALRFGDLVRVVDGYTFSGTPADPDFAAGGKIMQYMGPSDPLQGASVYDSEGRATTIETGDYVRVADAGAGTVKFFVYDGPTLQTLNGGLPLLDGFDISGIDFSGPSAPAGWTEVTEGINGLPIDGLIDLAATDFSDTDYWKETVGSQLIPQGLNMPNAGPNGEDSDSVATGAMFVYNQLVGETTATVKDATLRADDDITVRATLDSQMNATTDAATSSSGGTVAGTGTSRAISGVVATNLLTGNAVASAQDATLTARVDAADTTGSVTVEALNTVEMNANTSAVVATGDEGYNVLLAFNSMGYDPTNLLFSSFDALAGDPNLANDLAGLDTRNAVEAYAFMTGVTATAADAIIVNAVNEATLTALVNNQTTSAASAFIEASGTAVSVVMSLNKMLSGARAEVNGGQYYAEDGAKVDIKTGDQVIAADGTVYERTGADIDDLDFGAIDNFEGGTGWTEVTVALASQNTLDAGRAVIVTASDDSIVDADNKMETTTTVVNDGGTSILTGFIESLLGDYSFTTLSGLQLLKTGQQVLAGSNSSQAGKRYTYTGSNTASAVDLGAIDFGAIDGSVKVLDDANRVTTVETGDYVSVIDAATGLESFYKYIATDALEVLDNGDPVPDGVNLSTIDFEADAAWSLVTDGAELANIIGSQWKEVVVDDIESLIPAGINLNVTSSDATAVGLLFSVNDLQSGVVARLAAADVDVTDGFVLVSAIENATMDAKNA